MTRLVDERVVCVCVYIYLSIYIRIYEQNVLNRFQLLIKKANKKLNSEHTNTPKNKTKIAKMYYNRQMYVTYDAKYTDVTE